MDNTNTHTPGAGASGSEQKKEPGGFMKRFSTHRPDKDSAVAARGYEGDAQGAPRPEPERTYPARKQDERNVNVLTPGLVIEGNVTSQTDMVIQGAVHGDITCQGNVELSGEVTGNIRAKNVRINGGSVKGDIECAESLSIEKSQIQGNLSSARAQINNRIEGNIAVQGTLSLQREANIQGEITAAGLSVEEGAMMNGRITITREPREAASGFVPKALRGQAHKPAARPAGEPASDAEGNLSLLEVTGGGEEIK